MPTVLNLNPIVHRPYICSNAVQILRNGCITKKKTHFTSKNDVLEIELKHYFTIPTFVLYLGYQMLKLPEVSKYIWK